MLHSEDAMLPIYVAQRASRLGTSKGLGNTSLWSPPYQSASLPPLFRFVVLKNAPQCFV